MKILTLLLKRNLKYLREEKNISQEDMAELLDVNLSTYRNYEKGRTELTASKLLKLSKYYGVTSDNLLTKDIGSPGFTSSISKKDNITSKEVKILPITTLNNPKQNVTNVEFVSVKAMAGYSIDSQKEAFVSNLPIFQIPKLPSGIYRAFEIEGNSMPPMEQGYIVIGKYVNWEREIKNGKRYILVLRDNGVVFKRVTNEYEQNEKLILVSDNSESPPFTVDAIDVLEAWEFVAFIGFPSKVDMNYIILDKLHEIEQKINYLASNA